MGGLLGILVTTKDRSETIRQFIDDQKDLFEQYDIDVYIVDGSENDTTKFIVDNCEMKNIRYRWMPGASIIDRTFVGLEMIRNNYVCIAGDSRRFKKERMGELIEECRNGYSLIQTQADKKGTERKEYNRIDELYKEYGCEAITYSTTVFKNDGIKTSRDSFIGKYGENNFFHLAVYFDRSGKDFKGVYLPYTIQEEAYRKEKSWWLTAESFFEVFGVQLLSILKQIPFPDNSLYMYPYKDIMNYGFHMDSLHGIFFLKVNTIIDKNNFEKNWNHLKLMSDLEKSIIEKVVREPEWLSEIQYCRFVKRYYRKIVKRIMPGFVVRLYYTLKGHGGHEMKY